jgi:hypothetical protein
MRWRARWTSSGPDGIAREDGAVFGLEIPEEREIVEPGREALRPVLVELPPGERVERHHLGDVTQPILQVSDEAADERQH